MSNMMPSTISKTIMNTEKPIAHSASCGNIGARKENQVPEKVDSNSAKYCSIL